MSLSSDAGIAQEDVAKVLEIAAEPSYISEIARKLIQVDPAWDVAEITAVEKVSIIVSMLEDRGDVNIYDIGYGTGDMGQAESSPKFSLTDDESGHNKKWNGYTLVYYYDSPDIREEYEDVVDLSVDPIDKIQMIEELSSSGNEVSKQAETIMQDVMERQFKHYDTIETPDYNDPDVDFYVEDESNREWGLAIEVSVRYVNPIDQPYLDAKKDKADERDADLLIIAPRFTDNLLNTYEDPDDPGWNADPLSDMVHLHRVPPDRPTVYYPFARTPDEIKESNDSGNPVIVSDGELARERLSDSGNVGDEYPVVDGDYGDFLTTTEAVGRETVVTTESQYRNSLRESIEPLLWGFLRPYKIEQFLVQTYWEYGMSQSDIGQLVDRAGSTIGSWMRDWGVMRRGTGAPELSEETIEIWRRMYEGEEPFEEEYSGYRILAEYNRHPLWGLDDWKQWYNNTIPEERKEMVAKQDSEKDNLGYTLMFNPTDRLQPSYSFILSTLKDNDVEIRPPDEAPRVPYSAYPSRKALEYMVNKDQDTIVDVGD